MSVLRAALHGLARRAGLIDPLGRPRDSVASMLDELAVRGEVAQSGPYARFGLLRFRYTVTVHDDGHECDVEAPWDKAPCCHRLGDKRLEHRWAWGAFTEDGQLYSRGATPEEALRGELER